MHDRQRRARVYRVVACLALLLTPGLAGAADALQACYQAALSQDDINRCAEQDARDSERELDDLLAQIQTLYQDDPALLHRLDKAQQAWLRYRQAQLELRYPPDELAELGGDEAQPTCLSNYQARLNRARIDSLGIWLQGVEEGDLCCGPVKSQEQIKTIRK